MTSLTWQRAFSLLPGIYFLEEEPSFFHFASAFVSLSFYMCTRAIVQHLRQAQHSAISSAPSNTQRTCRSERDNGSKQTELARASMSFEHLLYSSLRSQNKRKSQNLPVLQTHTSTHKAASLWCDARRFGRYFQSRKARGPAPT